MEVFQTTKIYDFTRYSFYGLIISTILCLGSVVLIVTKDFKLGIDFAGGSIVQIQYNNISQAPLPQIREILSQHEEFKGFQVSEFGTPNEVLIKLPLVENPKASASQIVQEILKSTGEFSIRRNDEIGAKVGDEFKYKGILSLTLAFIAMMIYISFRYEWRFALAGIVALMHDVILASAVVILADIDFNLEVLAALLTLIGYSINDTIIIFDRIREQMLAKRVNDMKYVINEALSRTLSRTLLTSLTVFFVVLTLYLFGGEIIRGFSLPMLAGVIIGTYSSMFVAPRLALIFGFNLEEYYQKEMKKLKKQENKKRLRAMYEKGVV
ncbi:protein translocase subunit SecF [Helicobacter equorum]|uniref:protein translocase subunit SecF n=1 Tax=Helicobacter equorum TaxID=361872 RepID=UPI000CF08421|nr:protein translocase subunit SecF [Helicobacter equorum]